MQDYKVVSENVAAIYNKNKYNVIYDLYDTKLNLNVEESAIIQREIKEKQTQTAHKIHIAACVSKINYYDWKFIEILHKGRSYDTKVFLEIEQA